MKSLRKAIAVLLFLLLALGCACASSEEAEWACPDCGAVNSANFCIKCGAKKPEEIVCPECGTKYPTDAGAVFCGNCGAKLLQSGPSAIRYEGEGFDTPEAALTCYIDGIRNLNFEQILSAFAWETQIEHYNFQAYFERIRVYQPTMRPRMPSINDFMYSANVNALRSSQTDLIYRSLEAYILGYDSPSRSATGTIVFQKDSDDVAVFLKKFENGKLEKLTQMTNIQFLSPDYVTKDRFSDAKNVENFKKQAAQYGADETVNLVGMADVGNESFLCCPTICRYGDKWYLVSVSSMTSNLLGLNSEYQAFICWSGNLGSMLH